MSSPCHLSSAIWTRLLSPLDLVEASVTNEMSDNTLEDVTSSGELLVANWALGRLDPANHLGYFLEKINKEIIVHLDVL